MTIFFRVEGDSVCAYGGALSNPKWGFRPLEKNTSAKLECTGLRCLSRRSGEMTADRITVDVSLRGYRDVTAASLQPRFGSHHPKKSRGGSRIVYPVSHFPLDVDQEADGRLHIGQSKDLRHI